MEHKSTVFQVVTTLYGMSKCRTGKDLVLVSTKQSLWPSATLQFICGSERTVVLQQNLRIVLTCRRP